MGHASGDQAARGRRDVVERDVGVAADHGEEGPVGGELGLADSAAEAVRRRQKWSVFTGPAGPSGDREGRAVVSRRLCDASPFARVQDSREDDPKFSLESFSR